MKILKALRNVTAWSSAEAVDGTRRAILKALPALALSPGIFAASASAPIAVRKLHSYGLRVADVDRSLAFYQELFGAAIQARQGDTICLRIGDGPGFFSLSPLRRGEQAGISHIGLSVEGFELDQVCDRLATFGVEPGTPPAAGQSALDSAMTSWTITRGSDAGGDRTGTRELYFAGLEGMVFQLSPEDHCGGRGALGSICENVEAAPVEGLFKTIGLSHFTNFLANSARGNAFYIQTFGKEYQAYQGPSPLVGVGDGIQFLMFVGGSAEGPPADPGRIDHVCLSIENFSVDEILARLDDYGFSARTNASDTPPLVHWVSMRMPNRGGIEAGTPEVYFSDPDGIRIQLQDQVYCGGGGYLGEICEPLA
jgi:catechol 2,3-dioxygenase-like lactoylglutathione lyase family enzyme